MKSPTASMHTIGELSVPASSSDNCPFPSRRSQLYTIAAARYRTGLRPLSPSAPSSPELQVRHCATRPVQRARVADEEGGPVAGSAAGAGGAGVDGRQHAHHPRDSGGVCADSDAPSDALGAPQLQNAPTEGEQHTPPPAEAPHPRTSTSAPPRKRARIGTPRHTTGAPVLLQQRKAIAEDRRRSSVLDVFAACLRSAAGVLTAAADFSGNGVSGRIVAAASSPSRALFCRFGPALVDIAALWLSPYGKVLCSCRGHDQNVALASITRRQSTCWHADVFRTAMAGLDSLHDKIVDAMQIKSQTEPHAFTFDLEGSQCALAFDGDTYSPVVIADKRFMRCISFVCRSLEHSCTHVQLTRALPSFASTIASDESGMEDHGSDDPSNDVPGVIRQQKASLNYGKHGDPLDDRDEILACDKERVKPNVLPCAEEHKLAERWLRTADVLSAEAATRTGSVNGREADGGRARSVAFTALLRCGLVMDPAKVLCERRCSICGAQKKSKEVLEEPAIIYTHHATAAPIQVCLMLHFVSVMCFCWAVACLSVWARLILAMSHTCILLVAACLTSCSYFRFFP